MLYISLLLIISCYAFPHAHTFTHKHAYYIPAMFYRFDIWQENLFKFKIVMSGENQLFFLVLSVPLGLAPQLCSLNSLVFCQPFPLCWHLYFQWWAIQVSPVLAVKSLSWSYILFLIFPLHFPSLIIYISHNTNLFSPSAFSLQSD